MFARASALVLILAAAGVLIYWLVTRWVEHDAGPFSFLGPSSLIQVPLEGEDSLCGEYRCSLFQVEFDYGIYGMEYGVKAADMAHEEVTLDGRDATILTFSKRETFYTAVRFNNVKSSGLGPIQLNLWVQSDDLSHRDAALRLIRSIRFE